MRQQLLVKMRYLGVANLANRLAIACDWRLELANFNFAFEWRTS